MTAARPPASVPSLFRTVAFNPRTLCNAGRLQDISEQFSNKELVLMAGTELRARATQPVSRAQTQKHWVWHFG